MSEVGLSEIMQRAQDMQKKLQNIQSKVASLEVTGEALAGSMKITVNGEHYAKKVEIDPNLLREPKQVLEDAISAAINDATNKVAKILRDEIGSLAETGN